MGFLASQLERLATKSSLFRGAVTKSSRPLKTIDTGVGHFADAYRKARGSEAWKVSSQMVKGFGQELTSRGSLGAMAISSAASGAVGYSTGGGSREDRLKRSASFAMAGAGAFAGYKAFRSPILRSGMGKAGSLIRNEFNDIRKSLMSINSTPGKIGPVTKAASMGKNKVAAKNLPQIINNMKPAIPKPTNISYKDASEAREYLTRLHRPMTTEKYGPGYSAVKNRAANQQQYNNMFVNTASPARSR